MSTNRIPELLDGTHKAVEIENGVIGACLLCPDAFPKIATVLRPEMFYNEQNRIVFQAMDNLFSQGLQIDLLTTWMEVKRMNSPELKHLKLHYEISLYTANVTGHATANVITWAYLLVEIWQNRETLYIQNGYYFDEDPAKARDIISEKLLSMAMKRTSDWVDASFVANQLLAHIDNIEAGTEKAIPLGLSVFDSVTRGGAKGGQLIVIGARPGVGKSAIINLWAANAATKNETVGIINLEMKDISSLARMVSMESDIEYWRIIDGKLRGDQERETMLKHLTNLANRKIFFTGSTELSMTDIRAKAYQLQKTANLGILFIDYLQLISPTKDKGVNREQQVAQISRGCKLLARTLDIPIVLLAQLNRDSTKGTTDRPKLTQLRESGAIEQDADIVILLHRDVDDEGEQTEDAKNEAFYKVAKHRDGKTTPWVKCAYDGPKMKFYDPQPVMNHNMPQQEQSKITRQDMTPPSINLPF